LSPWPSASTSRTPRVISILAQSATSHAISTLEDESQVKLFDRVGRHIELTTAGKLLLEEARGILARAATARLKK
jgi:DNA-binding transcriptional LysR family regulator